MKRIEKYNHNYNRLLGISLITLIGVTLFVGGIYFPVYIKKVMSIVRQEAIVTLKNTSSQNIAIIQGVLRDKKKLYTAFAENLEKEGRYDVEEILRELNIYVNDKSMYSIGLIDKEGICYTTLGEKLDLSSADYFIQGMKGISTITNSKPSQNKQELLNIITTPIYKEGEVEMILTVTYKASSFSKIFNITSFDGFGQSLVIDSQGRLITGKTNAMELNLDDEYDNNVYREETAQIVAEMIEDKKEQATSFEYKGETYLAYYAPVGINDWYLVSYVPKSYICNNIAMIKKILLSGCILIDITYIVFLGIFICEYIKYKKRINYLVFFDELTEEKNIEYLKVHFKELSEEEKKEKSLVVMDIHKFKSINIMYGSEVGDQVLRYIVKLFKEILPEDNLFRCQADVFAAIVNHSSRKEIVEKIKRLEARIKADIDKGLIVPIHLYFGICSLEEFSELHTIYNNALIAKNIVKGSINRNIKFFNQNDRNRFIENRQIEFDFVEAIKNDEFEVWYQPKYNVKAEEVYGAEALVRWRKQDGRYVFPSKFIPVLENTGQIIELDELVIEKIFRDMKEMKGLGIDIKPVSINLSRTQVTNVGLITKIKELVKVYEIDPSKISFEITETALVENSQLINYLIQQLHEMGFKIDLDDYGIGNSTLSSMFSSNFDTLKLDKTFADHIGNPKMNAIIYSTVEMAHKLNMTVVAEGIEKKEQVDFLLENNCNIIQGYYYSKPLFKEDYFNLLKQ